MSEEYSKEICEIRLKIATKALKAIAKDKDCDFDNTCDCNQSTAANALVDINNRDYVVRKAEDKEGK